MRWLRGVVATAALAGVMVVWTPVTASAAAILLVAPSTVNAGDQVQLRATCGDNTNPAFVTSRAFGSVTLVPQDGALRTTVTVPSTTRSGTYPVDLSCATGQTAETTLTVVGAAPTPNPNLGPNTGGGGMSNMLHGRLTLYGGLAVIVLGLAIALLGSARRGIAGD